MSAAWVTAIVAVVAALIAAGALWIASRQLRAHVRVSEAQLLVALDSLFREHDATHRKLRPPVPGAAERTEVGLWHGTDAEGPTGEHWVDVEAYMGLFERIHVMTNRKLLKIEDVSDLYGYRVKNIWSNPIIVEQKLVVKASGWRKFIALSERLAEHDPDSGFREQTRKRAQREEARAERG